MENEFYVGYLNKAPRRLTRFIRLIVLVLVLMVMVVAWLLATKQRGFIGSTYQYYRESEVSGLLLLDPVPAIQVHWGTATDQTPVLQTIPIVQFGKIGGAALAQKFEGSWVTAKGFLIYYDGKALIEIADPQNLKISTEQPVSGVLADEPVRYGAEGSFEGEIVDAKCFFGVMKPGHGKPHRSCAIRCISGGIPAVLHTTDPAGDSAYYLILTKSGSPKELTDYIGEQVTIDGIAGEFYDWKVLKINTLTMGAGERESI